MSEDLGKAADPFTSAFSNDTSQEDVFLYDHVSLIIVV